MIRWKQDWADLEDLQTLQIERMPLQKTELYMLPGYYGMIYTPTIDTWIYSENYTDGKVVSKMPRNIFQDGFGYEVKEQIKKSIKAYYENQIDREKLRNSFLETCMFMRQCRNEMGQTTGVDQADNMQIVGQVYEMYAKENQRAARRTNYAKGCAMNGKYTVKDSEKQKDWCYYNAVYYYICEDVCVVIHEATQIISEKWEIPSPDIEAIEKTSKIDLRGGQGFNGSWNSLYPNQISRVYMRDETRMPPEEFKFFYKEYNPVTGKGILTVWAGEKSLSMDVPFNSFMDNPRGQIYDAGELVQFKRTDTEDCRRYNQYLGNFSIFSRRYDC